MRKIGFLFLIIVLAIFFYFVFSSSFILPQSISLGFITIRYYGLFIAVAVAAGFYLGIKRAYRFGLTTKQAEDILFWTIVGGFVGARLYHVLSSLQFYLNHPVDIFKVWNGGLSIYGVIFGGAVSLLALKKILNLKSEILNLLNWLTPSLVIGQIIGRFGNFFNYELYGYPSSLPWKMFVPESFRSAQYEASIFFHPLFLYEQLGLLAIFFVVTKLENRKNIHPAPLFDESEQSLLIDNHLPTDNTRNSSNEKWSGASLFFWYVLLYNILRIPLEYLRVDSVFLGGVRQNALVSLVLIISSAGYIFWHARRKERVFS